MDKPIQSIDLTPEVDLIEAVRGMLARKSPSATDPCRTAIDNSIYHLGVIVSMLTDPLMRARTPAPRPPLKQKKP